MVRLAYLPLLPLLGALFDGLWVVVAARCKREPRNHIIAVVGTAVAFLSFLLAIGCVRQFLHLPQEERLIIDTVYSWINIGDLNLNIAFQLDPLSALMILIITGVGSLIHLYSIGYMHHDPGQGRFFVYLNLFLAAMLVLVLGSSLPLMFVGWEGVGLCSYLLIGFWFTDDAKASAGKKAFIVNRVGDLGFLLGIFLTFTTFQALDFVGIKEALAHISVIPPSVGIICLLLFVGACGKSAQFPLHVWLPDAMAGPTPVSALIHAATMVTAGVYMIARMSFLYATVPDVGSIVATVGVFTALFAALIALKQNDIKKVMAYSTVSQLGFMFLGVGVGAYTAGVFHLMTHAFFKALLFLGAGSVIHAMSEEQDMRKMGGLREEIPITFWTFLVAWAAILGLPPFSGFFSKDEILWKALENGYTTHYKFGLFAAGLTAFYMTRALIMTFFGESRASKEVQHHIHESPPSMTAPLIVLAILAFGGGFLHHVLERFFEPVFARGPEVAAQAIEMHQPHHLPFSEGMGSFIAVLVAVTGAALAFWRTNKEIAFQNEEKGKSTAERVATPSMSTSSVYWATFAVMLDKMLGRFIENKFYIDELYDAVIVKPTKWFSEFGLWKGFDVLIIDGFINALADVVGGVGGKLRLIQTGQLRIYALGLSLGAMTLIGYIAFILLRGF